MNVNISPSTKEMIMQGISGLNDVERAKMDHMVRISQDVFRGVVGDEIVCVWGLISPSLLSDQAYLWLYCTPAIEDHKFLFVRYSQRWMEKILSEYPTIIGYCNETNPQARRWIEWLGARFEPVDNLGRRKFTITRKLHG